MNTSPARVRPSVFYAANPLQTEAREKNIEEVALELTMLYFTMGSVWPMGLCQGRWIAAHNLVGQKQHVSTLRTPGG